MIPNTAVLYARVSSREQREEDFSTQAAQERARLERELQSLRTRMDTAYTDKLDGKISAEFWQRKQADWEAEEFRIKSRISGQGKTEGEDNLLSIGRILELAHSAHSLYVTREPAEQAELLKKSTFELLDRCCKSLSCI